MELKPYQEQVIKDLEEFLVTMETTQRIDHAYRDFWADRGVTGMDAYKNNVKGVPHVCAKVPTAGGKTFIAVNAIKTIFNAIHRHNPKRPEFVVWLVPSLTILDQTVNALSDISHPYRQQLNLQFRNRVAIYQKKDLLQGAGFSLDSVKAQLSIVVMSFDSLRAKNKEARKVFQDNGYLASFINTDNEDNEDWLLPDYDKSALINVIRRLKPVVIVDESHNAESKLSVEMMDDLNPHFIFDLTATPKNNSNIISYVDALQLKAHHMVKLPVIVANRQNKDEVVEAAIILRNQLEAIAIDEKAKGGKSIRPIVLFQAQPKTDDDNVTFEKLKQALVALKIPEEQIKIKTANNNELKDIDLMADNCVVRYIITINALKEGWDCPNAYILAALGDKSSAVDVEQILGRVLRMPHVRKHGDDMLNMSYVFTASNRFMETLENVVKALNRAGFSENDYRAVTPEDHQINSMPLTNVGSTDLFVENTVTAVTSTQSIIVINDDDLHIDHIANTLSQSSNTPANGQKINATLSQDSNQFVQAITVLATEQNQTYEAAAIANGSNTIPSELGSKMNRHKMNGIFRDQALAIKFPQFFIEVAEGGWFDEKLQLLERDSLLKEFKLSNLDATVRFDDVDSEMYRVDLEQIGVNEYTPKPFKIDQKHKKAINGYILAQPREAQIINLTARLFDLIGNLYPIDDADVKKYIGRIVEAMTPDQIRDCLERDVAYKTKIKKKIEELRDTHAYKEFMDLLETDKIVMQSQFGLPEFIAPSSNAPAMPKSLYSKEGSIGEFEQRVMTGIANLGNVEWWHRNISKTGFRINGYLNMYPDFIIKTKLGRIVVVETKGDDRGNNDSKLKLKLGKLWQNKVPEGFKYLMVFDTKPIEDAETFADALKKIGQL